VKPPKIERKEAAYFEPAQVDTIAEHLGGQHLLVLVLGRLGLRFGEAAGLERRHVVDVLRRRTEGRTARPSPQCRRAAHLVGRECEGGSDSARHRSAPFTLTVYGHLFDSDLDELAERLESFNTRG